MAFYKPPKERGMSKEQAITELLRVHEYFMRNPRFWYERELQAADMLICKAMSDLRAMAAKGEL